MATNRYGEQHRLAKGRMKVLEAVNQKLYRVEIWALNDQTNRNGWRYINLDRHLSQFRDIPLLTAYLPNGKIGDGHNFDMKRDPVTGEQYASFTAPDAERIVGWVPKDANIRIETENEVNWIVTEAYLWTWYARELVEKIARQGSGMEVSIETLVTKEHREGNVDVEEEYVVLGITILGDGVSPAVAGANIQTLTQLRSSMEKEILKAASYAKEKPKANKNKEGVKDMNAFSKKQVAELNKLFTGYRVLAAAQDEAGVHICLLSDTGETAVYTMGSVEDAVVPEKIRKVNAQVAFNFGEDSLHVSAADMMDVVSAKLVQAETSLGDTEKKLNAANETIKAMQEAEGKRRLAAAESAAEAALNEFNQNRESDVRVEAKVLEAIQSEIKAGAYSECADAEGAWNGEAKVREKVLFMCAEAVMEMDKASAQKNNSIHIWEKMGSKNPASDDSVDGLLTRMGIR